MPQTFDDIYGGEFIKTATLEGTGWPLDVVIHDVSLGTLTDQVTKVEKPQIVLTFQGWENKKLGLTKTNADRLARMFGKDFYRWSGQPIQITLEKASAFGETHWPVRVVDTTEAQPQQPGQTQVAAPAPAAAPAPQPQPQISSDPIPGQVGPTTPSVGPQQPQGGQGPRVPGQPAGGPAGGPQAAPDPLNEMIGAGAQQGAQRGPGEPSDDFDDDIPF